MGCHTWFSVPYIEGEEKITELAQKYIDQNTAKGYLTPDYAKMYQYAIDNKLLSIIKELAAGITNTTERDNKWILYKDINDYSVELYNNKNGTTYGNHDRFFNDNPGLIENYSDEPRIGGYPENVIESYDQMIEFMKTGFTDEKGNHHDFYYEESRKDNFMLGIKQFFINHPKGIITFG